MKSQNNITGMFKGYRIVRKKMNGKVVSLPQVSNQNLTKNLFKFLEKCKVITDLQYSIVQNQLNKCTEKDSPEYIARLDALLNKTIVHKIKEEKK